MRPGYVASVVIIGSVAWDEVLDLDAPLRVGSHNGARPRGGRIGGGAANTAMAMARAGDRVRVVSGVGADEAGERLLGELARAGVDTTFVNRYAAETTRSLVLLDERGERTVVNLARAAVPLPGVLADIEADWFYVRSADPALTPLMQLLVDRGRRVLAHVPPVREGFRPAHVLVGSASDLDEEFLAEPWVAGRRIAGETMAWMVVTFGADGATAYGPGGEIHQAARAVPVTDSTGAGDVFAGGLIHSLAAGASMGEALRNAVDWGTASVGYAGTVPPPGFPDVLTNPSPGT